MSRNVRMNLPSNPRVYLACYHKICRRVRSRLPCSQMSSKSLANSNKQAREASPFFSLPNEDGSNPHQNYDSDQSQQSQQHQPITLSCASCERIVGDSSAFLCATRQMGTITLDRMVSTNFGPGGLKTSIEGTWDEFWYGFLASSLCIRWKLIWSC